MWTFNKIVKPVSHNNALLLPRCRKEYTTVPCYHCHWLGSTESCSWHDLMCGPERKMRPSVTVYHPVSAAARLRARSFSGRGGSAEGVRDAFSSAAGCERRSQFVMASSGGPRRRTERMKTTCDRRVSVPRSTAQPERMMENPLSLVLHVSQTQFGHSSDFNDCTSTTDSLFPKSPPPKKKSVHLHLETLDDFYSALTLQIYNFSFEDNSEWLQLFISPRARLASAH